MAKLNTKHQRSASIIDYEDPNEDLGSATVLTRVQFLAVNQHYTAVLQGIGEQEELHAEFSSLLKIFQKSNIIQNRLAFKVKELSAALAVEQCKNASLESKVKEDKETVESLKNEAFELQRKVSEIIIEKRKIELEFMEFKEKIENFQQLEDTDDSQEMENAKPSKFQETLKATNKRLEQQLDSKISECTLLRVELKEAIKKFKNLQVNVIWKLKSELKVKNKQLKIANSKIQQQENVILAKDTKLTTLAGELENAITDKNCLENSLKRCNEDLKASQKDAHALFISCKNQQELCSEKEKRISNLLYEKVILQAKEGSHQKVIRSLRSNIDSLTKDKSASAKTIISLESQIMQVEERIKLANEEIVSTTQKLEQTQGELLHAEIKVGQLRHEKRAIMDESSTLQNTITHLHEQIHTKNHEKGVLQNELMIAKADVGKEDRLINDHILEKTHLTEKVHDLNEKLDKITNRLGDQERLTNIYAKEITTLNKKLSKARDDYGKAFLSHQKEREGFQKLKEEMSLRQKQIAALDIYANDLKIHVREEEDKNVHLRVSKDKFMTQYILSNQTVIKQNDEILKHRVQIHAQEVLIKVLRRGIRSKRQELRRSHVVNSSLLKSKRNDSKKLIKFKDEVRLYKEKVAILEILLSRSESAIRDRMGTIKQLNCINLQKSREVNLLKQQSDTCEIYKRQLLLVQNELKDKQIKGKALEEQVQQPSNMHRWRALKGSDPERLQLIVKNQFLQKIVIKKTTLLDVKDAELSKLQKAVKHHKNSKTEAQIGEARMVIVYKENFRKMKEKCESLTSQVNMLHSHFQTYRNQIAILREKLNKYEIADYMQKLSSRQLS